MIDDLELNSINKFYKNIILFNFNPINKFKLLFGLPKNKFFLKNYFSTKESLDNYYLKINLYSFEEIFQYDANLDFLKQFPPKRILIDFSEISLYQRIYETYYYMKKISNISTLEDIHMKEKNSLSEFSNLYKKYSELISNNSKLSLKTKSNFLIRFIRKIFKIDICFSNFQKALKSSFILWPKNKNYWEVSNEIISLAKEGSLIGEISRNKLTYELNNLSNKFQKIKNEASFIYAKSDGKFFKKKGVCKEQKSNLYAYLEDTSLIKEEVKLIDMKIQEFFRKKNIYFLNLSGINMRASFAGQKNFSHTLRWHRDYNSWGVIKVFIPVQIHKESFLEFIDNSQRSNPLFSYHISHSSNLNTKKLNFSIDKKNISVINTSSILGNQ